MRSCVGFCRSSGRNMVSEAIQPVTENNTEASSNVSEKNWGVLTAEFQD